MSNRTNRAKGRASACWHGWPEKPQGAWERRTVTAARREELRRLALEEPEKLVRLCRLCQVFALSQLPFWPEIRDNADLRYETASLIGLARDAGIDCR